MSWEEEKEKRGARIVRELYERGMIKTWFHDKPEGWRLVSGLWSPFYIQLRPLAAHPDLLGRIGAVMGEMVRTETPHVQGLVGVAMAGIPIATAMSLSTGIPALFTRKLEGVRSLEDLETKITDYGAHAVVEGELACGSRLACVDDLVTRFDSKLIAIRQIEYEASRQGIEGVRCDDVFVLLDREQGAAEAAKAHGIGLHALIPFRSWGLAWLEDVFDPLEGEVIRSYIDDPGPFQKASVQAELAEKAEGRVSS